MTTPADVIIGTFFVACAAILVCWCVWYWREHLAVLREFRAFLHDCFCDDDETEAEAEVRAHWARLSRPARPDADLSDVSELREGVAGLGDRRADAPPAVPAPFATRAAKGIKRTH